MALIGQAKSGFGGRIAGRRKDAANRVEHGHSRGRDVAREAEQALRLQAAERRREIQFAQLMIVGGSL